MGFARVSERVLGSDSRTSLATAAASSSTAGSDGVGRWAPAVKAQRGSENGGFG